MVTDSVWLYSSLCSKKESFSGWSVFLLLVRLPECVGLQTGVRLQSRLCPLSFSLLPGVFLFGLGFRFTNLCAVTNTCPVNEEIVSCLSPCCLPEVFMYGYQHVSGFRVLSGYREDCVLPFSRSLCARTFVCASGRKCVQCSLIRLLHVLVAAALAPPQQPWRQRQQLAPPLSWGWVDATLKNYFVVFCAQSKQRFCIIIIVINIIM